MTALTLEDMDDELVFIRDEPVDMPKEVSDYITYIAERKKIVDRTKMLQREYNMRHSKMLDILDAQYGINDLQNIAHPDMPHGVFCSVYYGDENDKIKSKKKRYAFNKIKRPDRKDDLNILSRVFLDRIPGINADLPAYNAKFVYRPPVTTMADMPPEIKQHFDSKMLYGMGNTAVFKRFENLIPADEPANLLAYCCLRGTEIPDEMGCRLNYPDGKNSDKLFVRILLGINDVAGYKHKSIASNIMDDAWVIKLRSTQ